LTASTATHSSTPVGELRALPLETHRGRCGRDIAPKACKWCAGLSTMPVTAVRERQTPSDVWSMQKRSPSVPSPTYSPFPDTTTAHSSQSSPLAPTGSPVTSPLGVEPALASCAVRAAALVPPPSPPGNSPMTGETSTMLLLCAQRLIGVARCVPSSRAMSQSRPPGPYGPPREQATISGRIRF
jgi:hypothetical protein